MVPVSLLACKGRPPVGETTCLSGSRTAPGGENTAKRDKASSAQRDGSQTTLPHFLTVLICQDTFVVIECRDKKVISIQSAFYRRHGNNICTL